MQLLAANYPLKPAWLSALLLAFCFSLAPWLQLEFDSLPGNRSRSGGLIEILMGESRQMFAQHFLVQADVYYHSGYYPSFFDQALTNKTLKITAQAREQADDDHDHEHEAHQAGGVIAPDGCDHLPEFIAEPTDWIDRFGRHFYNTEHRHITGAQTREFLPWLKMAAGLDPQRIETYVVTAYWLRRHLNKSQEAEKFLRQGLWANPNHPELLFELGCIFAEDRQDPITAQNLWQAALRNCPVPQQDTNSPNNLLTSKIALHLARLAEQSGQVQSALKYLEVVKSLSPDPPVIQSQIDALKAKQ